VDKLATLELPPDSAAARSLTEGRARRKSTPRRDHAAWTPPADRDPVATVVASNAGRIPDLVPIRMGRMIASPFAFFRGSAAVMAADLATTPVMGATVQLCGDAHLANFGIYGSPERRLVFDLNDFDETLPGPWEWDLKRLAASLAIASRENGFPDATARDIARRAAFTYRRWIRQFGRQRALSVWYAAIPIESILERIARSPRGGLQISIDDALRHDHIGALGKLSEPSGDGSWVIRHRPPLIQRLPDDESSRRAVPALYKAYVSALAPDRRILVEKHRIVDVALKVVGVGSVGTRCYIALMAGPAGGPLVLQMKEARPSVLEPYRHGRAVRIRNQGKRVVTGQRIMQAVSDIFLGWTKSPMTGVEYYVRQLRDMKYSVDIATLRPEGMRTYADCCGWALARAHARAGDPALIGGYLGTSDAFDEAVASFAIAYADQTERDHAELVAAVRAGRVEATTGI
jgi:uncharacterized protein (DUF2252 family)